jgi:hypothetical protein
MTTPPRFFGRHDDEEDPLIPQQTDDYGWDTNYGRNVVAATPASRPPTAIFENPSQKAAALRSVVAAADVSSPPKYRNPLTADGTMAQIHFFAALLLVAVTLTTGVAAVIRSTITGSNMLTPITFTYGSVDTSNVPPTINTITIVLSYQSGLLWFGVGCLVKCAYYIGVFFSNKSFIAFVEKNESNIFCWFQRLFANSFILFGISLLAGPIDVTGLVLIVFTSVGAFSSSAAFSDYWGQHYIEKDNEQKRSAYTDNWRNVFTQYQSLLWGWLALVASIAIVFICIARSGVAPAFVVAAMVIFTVVVLGEQILLFATSLTKKLDSILVDIIYQGTDLVLLLGSVLAAVIGVQYI